VELDRGSIPVQSYVTLGGFQDSKLGQRGDAVVEPDFLTIIQNDEPSWVNLGGHNPYSFLLPRSARVTAVDFIAKNRGSTI
jgi:hypothetical protein